MGEAGQNNTGENANGVPSQSPPFTGGVLTLDIARATGWAAASRDACKFWPATQMQAVQAGPHPQVVYGLFQTTRAAALHGEELHHWENWFSDLCDTFRPDWVAWEAPILNKKRDTLNKIRTNYGRVAIADVVCYRREIRCVEIPIQTIKRSVTGNGNAEKPEVVAAIEARGYQPEDDNVADALAVMDAFIHWYRALPKSRRRRRNG